MDRKLFLLSGVSAASLISCSSSSNFAPGTIKGNARSRQFQQPCTGDACPPPRSRPVPQTKYKLSLPGSTTSANVGYNNASKIYSAAYDNGSSQLIVNGVGSSSIDASGNLTTAHTLYDPNGTAYSYGFTLPPVQANTNYTVTDTVTGQTHTISVGQSSASCTIVDGNGVSWLCSLSTNDGATYIASWSSTVDTGSVTFTVPAADQGFISDGTRIAFEPHSITDGTEVARNTCRENAVAAENCGHLASAMAVTAAALAAFGGPLGMSAGLVIGGLALAPIAFGEAAVIANGFNHC